jgi:hypothetical protein
MVDLPMQLLPPGGGGGAGAFAPPPVFAAFDVGAAARIEATSNFGVAAGADWARL